MENANSQESIVRQSAPKRSGGVANRSGFAAWHPRARRVDDCSIRQALSDRGRDSTKVARRDYEQERGFINRNVNT